MPRMFIGKKYFKCTELVSINFDLYNRFLESIILKYNNREFDFYKLNFFEKVILEPSFEDDVDPTNILRCNLLFEAKLIAEVIAYSKYKISFDYYLEYDSKDLDQVLLWRLSYG